MKQFVIERNMPGIGNASADDLKGASNTSCDVLRAMGPEIQWVHSYVTDDKIYCVYLAESEDEIRNHAKAAGLPATRVSPVKTILDPTNGN